MYNLFNSKNPLLNLLFPGIAVLLIFNLPSELIRSYYTDNISFLYSILLSSFGNTYFVIIYKIVTTLLLSFNAVFFSQMIIKVKFFDIYNNFHGFIFLFLYSILIRQTDVLPLLISLAFFLAALFILLKTLRKKYALLDIFNVGFLLAFGSFFRFETVYFFPIILIGLLILRSVNLREWLIALIGTITPYFIGFSLYYFFYSDFDIVTDTVKLIGFYEKLPDFDLIYLISLSVIGLITLVTSFKLFAEYRTKETDIQDYMRVFFMLFLLASVLFILVPGTKFTSLSLLIPALTIPVSIFFKSIEKRILREIFFDLFLTCLIFNQIDLFRSLNF